MSYDKPFQSPLEAMVILGQMVLLLPVLLVVTIGVVGLIAYEMGLPGSDVGTYFLHDAFGLLISALLYVVAVITVPAILRALSDPEWAKLETRQAMWSFTAVVCSVVQQIAQPLEWLARRSTASPILVTSLGNRFAIRPLPSFPALGFFSGSCPQLE